MRKRLNKSQAEKLGLKVKKNNSDGSNPKYSITRDQVRELSVSKDRRVLVIGDIHAPFERKDYLQFCIDTYNKWNCNTVVFIGDIIDNHYSSYHETDADGLGGGEELDLAIKSISKWYKAFPNAYVTIGNHDAIIMRKAQTSSIPSQWIKNYSEVLGTEGWEFVTDVVIDDVRYVHGHKSSKAREICRVLLQDTIILICM